MSRPEGRMCEPCTTDDLVEAGRGLRIADPDLGLKPLLDKLRERMKVCFDVAKPEWWNDEELKALSARVLRAAPNDEGVNQLLRRTCCNAFLEAVRGLHVADPDFAGHRSLYTPPRARMALLALDDDALGVVFEGLRNVLEPRVVLALGSACHGLWALTQALRQQLRADHEAAAALCLKVGMRSCKELRETKEFTERGALCRVRVYEGLSEADVALLGTLGSVLPALEKLCLGDIPGALAAPDIGPDILGPGGVQRLVEGLGAGALPAVCYLQLINMHAGNAGASALAAAMGRGALPRLRLLDLGNATIGDAGLVALAPALRRLPALMGLRLCSNPIGDEGIAALVAPQPPAGALPPPTGGLAKLKRLDLSYTQITDAGCAALASALDSGTLPALNRVNMGWGEIITAETHCVGTPRWDAADVKAARVQLQEGLKRSKAAMQRRWPPLLADPFEGDLIWFHTDQISEYRVLI
eukprot:scaffold48633_cov63-Phaeocystis_antarctica.AAC.1